MMCPVVLIFLHTPEHIDSNVANYLPTYKSNNSIE